MHNRPFSVKRKVLHEHTGGRAKAGSIFRSWGWHSGGWRFLVLLLFIQKVESDSLQPQGLQHARLSCLALYPGICSDSCPLSWWCHPTISSSVIPFFSHLQSFPASGSFPMSWFFTSGGQSIGASALASVLPMNIQGWFPLGWTGLIILIACRKRFLKQHEGWRLQG